VSSGLLLALAIQYIRTTVKVAGSAHSREKLRGQFGTTAVILPRTRVELYWFVAVSLTAGFCEEFLFRGYLIWAFAPWLGWWGAASISVTAFAAAHAYQGASGILRTGILGVLITLVVAIFGSLWPAVALHALLDIGSGIVAWLALREEPTETGSVEAENGWS
jgi:membrane protease YdiL (CAAX protease family)